MGGLPDPNSGCRKHPNHNQLPGVCSFCLRESLSKLTNATAAAVADDDSNTTAYYSSLSSSPAYSDASSFSPAVVTAKAAAVEERKPRQHHRRRNGSGSDDRGAVPLGFLLNEGNSNGDLGLKKSRSVGCAPRISRGANGNCNGKGNGFISNGNGNGSGGDKKGGKKSGSVGFWKRLIHSTSKKTKGVLMHSSTMKERFNEMSSSSSRRL